MWQVDVWFKGSVQQECRGMYKLTWHICLVFVSADLTRRFLSLPELNCAAGTLQSFWCGFVWCCWLLIRAGETKRSPVISQSFTNGMLLFCFMRGT